MTKKVKITKLCLDIGGKKIELTMKQAKELQEVLNASFGSTEYINLYPRTYWAASGNSLQTVYSSDVATLTGCVENNTMSIADHAI